MKTIKCPYCGHNNSNDDLYCGGCGTRLEHNPFNVEEEIKNDDATNEVGYDQLGVKFETAKSVIVSTYCFIIIFPLVLAIGFIVGATFLIEYELIPSLVMILAGVVLIFTSILCTIMFSIAVKRERETPLQAITYNKEISEFMVYTKTGLVRINKENIIDLILNNTSKVKTGYSYTTVTLSYGTIVFVLKDGSKVISVSVNMPNEVYDRIKNIIG